MPAIYNADAHSTGEVPNRPKPSVPSAFHDLPDIYRPLRRFPPIVIAGGMFVVAAAVFLGAEANLPAEYKPSRFIGGYQREIAQARVEGELTARVAYDGRLKLIETDAQRWQEKCRAGLQNANNYYQAAYSRANMYAQTTADIQKQYASTRYSVVQQSLGGEIGAANLATTFGFFAGLFDVDMGRQSMELAERARSQALEKLDAAARSGVTVSVDGWDNGLPNPGTLPAASTCDLPSSLATPSMQVEG